MAQWERESLIKQKESPGIYRTCLPWAIAIFSVRFTARAQAQKPLLDLAFINEISSSLTITAHLIHKRLLDLEQSKITLESIVEKKLNHYFFV